MIPNNSAAVIPTNFNKTFQLTTSFEMHKQTENRH